MIPDVLRPRGLRRPLIGFASSDEGPNALGATGDVEPLSVSDAAHARGRNAAREALGQVGVDPGGHALARLPDGTVDWPEGSIGSITHTQGWTGAVAARRRRWGGIDSIGLDAERIREVDRGLLDVICSPRERAALDVRLSALPGWPWVLVMVTAKEAGYKAAFPLTGRRADWLDVSVHLGSGYFVAEVDGDHPVRASGRFVVGDQVVVSLAVVRSGHTLRGITPHPGGPS